jgi:prepilin-type processing-associated H-X9-DG protein
MGTADHPWFYPTNYLVVSRGQINVGSYALSQYLTLPSNIGDAWQFGKNIPAHPAETPAFADSIAPVGGPLGVAMPATNLYTGYYTVVLPGDSSPQDYRGMTTFTIARHGSRPASAAPRWVDISKPLPGMINMALYDGHVEKAKLENLWNYYWSFNWWIPSPRPGLPGFDR